MNHTFKLILLFLLFQLGFSKPVNIIQLDSTLELSKGTRVYFLTNGTEADLKEIKVTAEKSGIHTNVFDYSLPIPDGSLSALTITADNDVLKITKPDGNRANVKVYHNNVTSKLNVYPVYEKSVINSKYGVNVFFAVDSPAGKILTVKNLNIADGQSVVGHSGVPGKDVMPVFFDSSVFKKNKYYDTLNVPLDEFYFDTIDLDVSYEVSFAPDKNNFVSSGLIMTRGFPYTNYLGDTLRTVKSNGAQVTLHLKPFFNNVRQYSTDITVYYEGSLQQGYSFSSGIEGKMSANGKIMDVEINAGGPYAIQYYSEGGSENAISSSTSQPGAITEKTMEATTKFSSSLSCGFSLLLVLLVREMFLS